MRSRPAVALTFHGAGDAAVAEEVLRAVEQAGARVTVLAVGTWLEQYPDMARRITGAGHELGNHTWSHPSLGKLPSDRIREEIERCRDQLDRLTGSPGVYFRQSAGQHATPEILRLAGSAGYHTVLSYDVDSLDWTDPGPAAVRRNVAKAAQPGSIVSMHFGHQGTAAAISGVLTDLTARGLHAVTASTLLSA